MQEKLWIHTADGKLALEELRDMPNAILAIKGIAAAHIQVLENRVLGINVADESKDRSLIVAKAELDGANSLLSSITSAVQNAKSKR